MSRTTRLVLGGAALVLLIGGVWFGLTPKAIHISDCGSPFFPGRHADKNSEAAECAYALNKRYTLLWVVFTSAVALGLAAAAGGMFNRPGGQAVTRTRLHLAGIVVIAVVYTAFIAVLVQGNRSEQAFFVMLGVSICAPILVAWGRPLLMVAATIGIIVYTGFAAVATNVATGHEEDPFGPHCAGNWHDLIYGEECD